MAGYAKIWTDIFDDEWFVSLNATGRGIWLQLIVWAKRGSDTGTVTGRSWVGWGSSWGCDGKIARKYLALFQANGRVEIIEEKNCITIKILNYQYYQEVNAKEHIKKRGKVRQKSSQKPPLPDQSRPDQSRPDQSRPDQSIYCEVVSDLNLKTGKHYKPDTPDTKKLIKNLLDMGYVLSDFQYVHTVKAKQWRGDPKMDKFLRPSTLYQPAKFAGYLNESEPNLSLTETARHNINAVAQAKTELFGESKPVEYEVLPDEQ